MLRRGGRSAAGYLRWCRRSQLTTYDGSPVLSNSPEGSSGGIGVALGVGAGLATRRGVGATGRGAARGAGVLRGGGVGVGAGAGAAVATGAARRLGRTRRCVGRTRRARGSRCRRAGSVTAEAIVKSIAGPRGAVTMAGTGSGAGFVVSNRSTANARPSASAARRTVAPSVSPRVR
jgi:hypothetical protein